MAPVTLSWPTAGQPREGTPKPGDVHAGAIPVGPIDGRPDSGCLPDCRVGSLAVMSDDHRLGSAGQPTFAVGGLLAGMLQYGG